MEELVRTFGPPKSVQGFTYPVTFGMIIPSVRFDFTTTHYTVCGNLGLGPTWLSHHLVDSDRLMTIPNYHRL